MSFISVLCVDKFNLVWEDQGLGDDKMFLKAFKNKFYLTISLKTNRNDRYHGYDERYVIYSTFLIKLVHIANSA